MYSARPLRILAVLTCIGVICCGYSRAQAASKQTPAAHAATSGTKTTQAPPPDVPLGEISADNPLKVSGIVIDRTAANPVVAREEAIAAARRAAFRKLAQTALSPAAYAALKMPSDNDLSLMVQDFEIENEQMSSTRYIGTFTVRFNAQARAYIEGETPAHTDTAQTPFNGGALGTGLSTGTQPHLNIEHAPAPVVVPQTPDAQGIIWNAQGQLPAPPPSQAQTAPPPSPSPVAAETIVLVLPYYENISGQTLLWEEPNPWLHAWQSMNVPAQNGVQYIVPLGDIDDMAAGPAGAVWRGDDKTIENLRRHYGAGAVALVVANRSGPDFSIDMYYYAQGSLHRRLTLRPFVPAGTPDEEAFRAGVQAVLQALKPQASKPVQAHLPLSYVLKPQPQAPVQPPPLAHPQTAVSVTPAVTPAPAAKGVHVSAQMAFSDFNAWMDVQRRVAAIVPPIKLSLDALSSDGATFTLGYAGTLPALTDALAAQGLVLSAPARRQDGTLVYALTEAH